MNRGVFCGGQKLFGFISHATENKIEYVDDLVEEIKSLGISVFYDSNTISWGDDLKERINKGLQTCELAVIVISPEYFGRKWTEYEIKTLLERQHKEQNKLILPLLYRVSKEDFISHYPTLKNIFFKYAKSVSKKELAVNIKNELEKKQMKKVG